MKGGVLVELQAVQGHVSCYTLQHVEYACNMLVISAVDVSGGCQ